MKRKPTAVILCAAFLIAAAAFTLVLTTNYMTIGGRLYHKNTEVLDLSHQTVEDPRALARLTRLRTLDLRGTQLSFEDHAFLCEALPECDILWLVPFQKTYLPTDTRQITVSALSDDDISVLSFLPSLDTVDATQCTDITQILKLQETYPQCRVLYRHTFSDAALDQDSTAFSSSSAEEIAAALASFPKLTEINAAGCEALDMLLTLQEQYPNCHIAYEVPLEGRLYRENTTSLTLETGSPEALAAALPYLPALESVTMQKTVTDLDAMAAIRKEYPHISFTYSFDFLGRTVSSKETFLDFSGMKLENTDVFDAYMPHFDVLEKVDLCNCGISNEEMHALNQRYPQTLFVWQVRMGSFYLRTDIDYFMPWKYSYEVTDADVDSLKYLTELICLDLGHMEITDTSFLANMSKMQYLMLGCSTVSDISYCADMPDLVYFEIFTSNVTDFSPLLACKKLVDLNVCHTKPSDPLIFCRMTQLENLWYNGDCSDEIKEALQEALPNTHIVFTTGSSTAEGWRQLPNYYKQRDIMDMFYLE